MIRNCNRIINKVCNLCDKTTYLWWFTVGICKYEPGYKSHGWFSVGICKNKPGYKSHDQL